jgi:hypothetical protein
MKFAVKMDSFSNTWAPLEWANHPTLFPSRVAAHSLSSSLSHPSTHRAPLPSHSPSHSLSLFFQNPSSREGFEVSMWYHCDHKLMSYPSLQFIFIFLEDLSRIWCLLVFRVEM